MSQLLVIGTGLIGGSFALAMRRAGTFQSIAGFDADASVLARAKALGIIDTAATDMPAAAAAADAVMIAVPPAAIAPCVLHVLAAVDRSVPVFDAGSVKGSVVKALRDAGGMPAQFVPSHPMAGSERHGPDAADAELFRDRHVILTPEPETDPAAVASVRRWWTSAGATVSESTAAVHDEMVALTSHMPHLLAHAFMAWVGAAHSADPSRFAGPGLRDFTRLAGSDPTLWRQIFAANRTALLHEFDGFVQVLAQVGNLLEDNRLDELEALLSATRAARARLLGDADE